MIYSDRVAYIRFVLFIIWTMTISITILSVSFPFAMDIISFISHYFCS